jgi:peptidoglycan-N-acetylglucosamine deacetylase
VRIVGVLVAAALSLPAPADLPTVPRLTDLAKPVYCAFPRGRNFALTFDDGPSPYSLRLARALRTEHARATFFVVGSRIALWPGAVRALSRIGELGNHTWSHPHLATLAPREVRAELERTQRAIGRELGAAPRLFRPPYEEASLADDRIARAVGLLDLRWSVDSGDSGTTARPAAIVRAVKRGLRPGAIVLLHDPHPWTAGAVRAIVREGRRRGLRAVTVSELLNRQPPSERQLSSTGSGRCPPP